MIWEVSAAEGPVVERDGLRVRRLQGARGAGAGRGDGARAEHGGELPRSRRPSLARRGRPRIRRSPMASRYPCITIAARGSSGSRARRPRARPAREESGRGDREVCQTGAGGGVRRGVAGAVGLTPGVGVGSAPNSACGRRHGTAVYGDSRGRVQGGYAGATASLGESRVVHEDSEWGPGDRTPPRGLGRRFREVVGTVQRYLLP